MSYLQKGNLIKTIFSGSLAYLSLIFLCFNPLVFKAQMVGANAYIKATSVEVGICGAGGFEGVDITTSPVLPGMHPRTTTTNYFGFVANPLVNGWASFNGDFFTPGTPENGWGVDLGVSGSTGGGPSNNCFDDVNFSSTSPRVDIPGTITNWSHTANCYSADWNGNLTNASTNLHFKINYFLQQNDLFYTTTISITNNTSATIPLLYYYRSLDPDNDVSLSGSYSTQNTIEDQPTGAAGSCNIACVSATQSSPTNSYLGLAGVGTDFRVTYGGFSNRLGSDIWNGNAGLTQTQGSTNQNDEAISLAYRIQNFLPGTTRTFKFVTILSAADKTKALDNLLFLSYPGSQNLPPAICTPGVDTVQACGGSVPINISGPNVTDYSWSWSPTTFLSSTNTSSAVASPPAITMYTVTGTPLTPCASPTPLVYLFVVKPLGTLATTVTANSPLCTGSTLSLTANGGAFYTWTGPSGFSSAVQSPTLANVTSGAAGIYTVVITTTAGCSGTGTVNVSLGSASSPTLGSNGPICSGSTLSLTATAGATSYTWTGPGGFSSNLQNPTIASVTSSGLYTLTTAGVPCLSINTISVSVVSTTTVSLGSNSPICSGSTLNLTSTAAPSYTWAGPGGFTSNLQNPTIAGITSSGVYTLTTGASLCLTTATITTTVVPVTSATLSSNSPICAGNTLSLTSTGMATTYTWTGPGGFTSNLQNPTISSIGSSGVYSLSTGSGPCITTNTIGVVVVPAIPVALTPIPVVCNNGTINFSAPAGGTSYTWVGPNLFTSSSQNPSISNASILHQGVYSLSITTGACLNTGTVNVSVYNPLSFATLPSSITLCAGKTGTLNLAGAGGSGTYNYVWSPITDLSSPNASVTTVTGNTTTDYTITLSDANCAVTPTQTVDVLVTVNPTPVITFSTSNARGCESFTTDLISTSVPTSTNCVWKFSNNLGTTNCNEASFLFPTHGTYNATLTVTDINGCVDSLSQNAFVIVDPKPYPDFVWTPGNATILVNEVAYEDQSTIGLPMVNWHWDFGDVFVTDEFDTSNVKNPSHIYNNALTYTVALTVTNSFGCTDTVTKLVKVEDDLAVFIPNAFTPSKNEGKNDVFRVQGIGFMEDGFEMAIFDRWGSVVFKTNDVHKGWDGSIKGGAKGSQGVYVYKIKLKDYKNRDKEYVGHITLL